MALFLGEAVASEETTITLEEAHLGLIEAAESVAELNEALLRADFVIHERSRLLSEADQETAKVGFLKKAVARIKEVAAKVKAKVLAFFQAAAARLKRLWLRVSGKDKNLKVPKGAVEMLGQLLKHLDEVATAVAAIPEPGKAAEYNTSVKKAVTEFNAYRDKVRGLIGDHSAYEEVKPSTLSKVNDAATRFAAIGNSAKSALEKAQAEVDKGLVAKIPGTTANAAVGALRAAISGTNQLAAAAGSVLALVGSITGVRDSE